MVTDSSSAHAQVLTGSLLAAAQRVEGISIAAVVDTGNVDSLSFAWSCVSWILLRLFNPGYRKPMPCSSLGMKAHCRKASVPYLAAASTDLSQTDIPANVLVSIYCLRKFSHAFLQKFDYAVNYHNGPLPAYRGRLATNWEIYYGEPRSGFTFHRLTEGIDEGNVLAAGSVSGDGSAYKFQLERLKTYAAATLWPDVIGKIKHRDEGTKQCGLPRNYTRQTLRVIREIDDPASITLYDLERRIRCFEFVRIRVNGRVLPVSAIKASAGGSRFDVVTADGAKVRAVRFNHLPYWLYRLGQLLTRMRAVAWEPLRRLKGSS